MANLFKGMSQTNFLDGLVQATGKNGHELFDFLVKLAANNKEPAPKIEEEKEVPQYSGTASFTGTRKDFYGFLELHGGNRYNKNGIDTWSACSVEALANYAAKLLKVQYFDFYWIAGNGKTYRICGENS